MDKRSHHDDNFFGDEVAGMICKSTSISTQDITDDEMKEINKYTLTPLSAEEVFTFKTILCDNEVDRQYEHFTVKSLHDMARLYKGRTVIKDHCASADNQVARIYATEVVDTGKQLKNGEPYQQLVAKCYMVRTESNSDLIKEIQGGIKKEGSVGFRPETSICSICGTDNTKNYCRHFAGRSYEKEGGSQVCTFKLDGVKDAYEFSLVAIPAQRRAGVSKSYTGEIMHENAENDSEKAKEIEIRTRIAKLKSKI